MAGGSLLLIRNSLAHLAARSLSLAAGLITIPLVSITLGREPLGLVGVYISLQGMLALVDLGLPIAVNQEVSVLSTKTAAPQSRASLIRSLEVLCWTIAAAVMALGLAATGPLVYHWFNVGLIPHPTLELALALIFVAVAVRLPIAFYSNALFGMNRHFYPNFVTSVMAVIRVVAAVIALVTFEVGLIGFFVIQLIANILEVLLLAVGVWRRERWYSTWPRLRIIRELTPRVGLFFALSAAAAALAQIDKVILSKMLSLTDFGIYSAGYSLAAGLLALSYPVSNAAFPQMVRDIAEQRQSDLRRLVLSASEFTILLIVPISAVIIARPDIALEILFATHSFPKELEIILPIMIAGGIAFSFVTLPHMYIIASGRLRHLLLINLMMLPAFAGAIWAGAAMAGIWGAAIAFAAMCIVRVLAYWSALSITGTQSRVWRNAAGIAIAAIAGCVLVARYITLWELSLSGRITMLFISCAILAGMLALVLPDCRQRLRQVYSLVFEPRAHND